MWRWHFAVAEVGEVGGVMAQGENSVSTIRSALVMRHNHPTPNPDQWLGLRYFQLPDDLITHYGPAYLYTATQAEVTDFTRADAAQLRFMLSGEGHYVFSSGKMMRTPRVCMLGPTLGATHFTVSGPVQVLGINVMPLGWLNLVDGDASVHADSLLDMEGEGDDGYAAFMAELAQIEDPEVAVAGLWQFLRDRMKPVSQALRRFVFAMSNWLIEEKLLSVESLSERTGLSARQVSRLTNRLFGCSPKYMARKARAHRCARSIGIDGVDWQDMVGEAFYDQSHLIRELKHFIGMTPHQIRNSPTLLAQLQFRRREYDRAISAQLASIIKSA